MPRLAKEAKTMRSYYDVVVVGSGYGGGVAASRLARAGLSVCVLERGRELLPGEFPDTLFSSQAEMQLRGESMQMGAASALFDVRLGDGVHVLSGCGLGGTSLINANVCLTPHDDIFEDEIWPSRLRQDHWLNLGFHRARAMLQPGKLPTSSTPAKLKALERAAEAVGREVSRVPLHITFDTHVNPAGVRQHPCIGCGDCISGCNVGAKTTVHSTYLTDAVNHGAEIFTQQSVRFIEQVPSGTGEQIPVDADEQARGASQNAAAPDGSAPGTGGAGQGQSQSGDAHKGKWRVLFAQEDKDERLVTRRAVFADKVVIAAGTLGTADIMMRSHKRGLVLSNMLGKRFSSNADSISFGYNNDVFVNGIGTGRKTREGVPEVGPAVCGMVDLRGDEAVADQLVVVEASIQSAMAPVMPMMLSAGSATGTDMDAGLRDALEESGRTLESLIMGAYSGAVSQTQTFLVVGNDDSGGEIRFENDHARVHWPDAAKNPVFKKIDETLRALIKATGGTYIPNPATMKILGNNLMTVHPLGGCVMGEDASSGVVDHKCRVFNTNGAAGETSVYDGLYICDGSTLPRSVGVHPLMTITAIAERAMALAARDHQLSLTTDASEAAPLRDYVSRTMARAETVG